MLCCTDTTSRIVVRLGLDEALLDYEYTKITCGREINTSGLLKKYLAGKTIKDIINASFTQIKTQLCFDEIEQFLARLEWDALQNALLQYIGTRSAGHSDRYKLAAIIHEKEYLEIRQITMPIKNPDAAFPATPGI